MLEGEAGQGQHKTMKKGSLIRQSPCRFLKDVVTESVHLDHLCPAGQDGLCPSDVILGGDAFRSYLVESISLDVSAR